MNNFNNNNNSGMMMPYLNLNESNKGFLILTGEKNQSLCIPLNNLIETASSVANNSNLYFSN